MAHHLDLVSTPEIILDCIADGIVIAYCVIKAAPF
jgi:hypothetical protein